MFESFASIACTLSILCAILAVWCPSFGARAIPAERPTTAAWEASIIRPPPTLAQLLREADRELTTAMYADDYNTDAFDWACSWYRDLSTRAAITLDIHA